MKVLYDAFIKQIKQDQIKKYNQKHQSYLKRMNKQQNNFSHNQNVQTQNLIPIQNRKRQRFISKKQISKPNKEEMPLPAHRPSLPQQEQTVQYVKEKIQPINEEKIIVQRKIPVIERSSVIQMSEFPPENEVVELFQCPQGCGRKFRSSLLQKHAKLCQKQGQQKRKPFQVKIIDEQAEAAKIQAAKVSKVKKEETKEGNSKWKKESQNLRNILKKNRGEAVEQVVDDRILCGGCGRKFSEKAAEKHIQKCMNRKKMK